MKSQAAIYARVSTEEQAKGYSLKTQLEACRNHATQRGFSIVAEFAEDYTGATMDRPELNRLRDFLAVTPVEVIVIYDLDRLARKSAYQVLIEEEFNRAGAALEFVAAHYDDSEEGRLQKQIRGVIAEYEKAKIMERSRRGKRGKAQSGFVLTGARPPYGYSVRSEPHKAWLEVDEVEADVVRMVYDWFLNGDEAGNPLSANSIAVRLTNLGIPTRGDSHRHVAKKFGKGVWQRTTVVHILTNETYTGTWHFGKTRMIDDGRTRVAKTKRGLGKQVPRSRDEWIPVPVPAIIEPELFARVQKRKQYLKRALSGHPKNAYLLKGRLTCAKCGYSMRGQMVRGKYQYYLCNGRNQIVHVCDMSSTPGARVDALAWDWVRGIVEKPENIRFGLEGVQQELQQKDQALAARSLTIERQLKEKQSQLEKLLDLYLAGEFPRELLTDRKSLLEGEIAKLRATQADMTAPSRKAPDLEAQSLYLQAFCATIRKSLDKADFNIKRQILELLDVQGHVAVESGEKVVYLKCLIDPSGQQRLLPILTSPSLNTGATGMRRCAFLPTAPSR